MSSLHIPPGTTHAHASPGQPGGRGWHEADPIPSTTHISAQRAQVVVMPTEPVHSKLIVVGSRQLACRIAQSPLITRAQSTPEHPQPKISTHASPFQTSPSRTMQLPPAAGRASSSPHGSQEPKNAKSTPAVSASQPLECVRPSHPHTGSITGGQAAARARQVPAVPVVPQIRSSGKSQSSSGAQSLAEKHERGEIVQPLRADSQAASDG